MTRSSSLSSDQPVRAAILGCGAITELFHAPALRALQQAGRVRVTHVCDPTAERVAAIRNLFPESAVLASLGELADARPEVVVVASPVRYHAEQTIAALEAGAAVLCEKPMAATTEEARQMIRAAERTGRPLAIGLCRRYLASAMSIKQMVDLGVLGRLETFHFQEGYDSKWPAKSPTLFQKQMGGGGVLLDLGVHVLDLLAWWFGMPSDLSYRDDAFGGVEANCDLEMMFPAGLRGRVRLSRDWGLRRYCRIEGERGWIEWEDVNADRLSLKLKGEGHLCNIELRNAGQGARPSTPVGGLRQAFVTQALNIVAAHLKHDAVRVPGTEGIRSLEIIERCYHSTRQPWGLPWFTEQERLAAAQLRRLD